MSVLLKVISYIIISPPDVDAANTTFLHLSKDWIAIRSGLFALTKGFCVTLWSGTKGPLKSDQHTRHNIALNIS